MNDLISVLSLDRGQMNKVRSNIVYLVNTNNGRTCHLLCKSELG